MTEHGPILDQLNLVVTDMEASVAFFRLLGVTIPDTASEWQADHRNAETDGAIDLDFDSVGFAPRWNSGWPRGRAGVVIGFKLASRLAVDETVARLAAAGYRLQQEAYDAPWGARYAVVEDPDGNAVGLMSPIDPAMRSPWGDPPTSP